MLDVSRPNFKVLSLLVILMQFSAISSLLKSGLRKATRQGYPSICCNRPAVVSTALYGSTGQSKGKRSPFNKKGGGQEKTQKTCNEEGTRLNKCIPALSRRGADEAIQKGLVTVNGKVILSPGYRVSLKDKVAYEGRNQLWQERAKAKRKSISSQKVHEERNFIYLKYWKPRGVTCTSDPSDPSNIISAGGFHLFPQRIFTVGRLDKESTGLILLTSDGRVNHALLGTKFENSPITSDREVQGSVKEKVYVVEVGPRAPSDSEIKRLSEGVVITTEVQKDNNNAHGVTKQKKVEVSAKTLPCKIRRIGGAQASSLEITLVEGRNRQIRKMIETLGLRVISLHRTAFAGISLRGLGEGNWAELEEREMGVIEGCIERAKAASRR